MLTIICEDDIWIIKRDGVFLASFADKTDAEEFIDWIENNKLISP